MKKLLIVAALSLGLAAPAPAAVSSDRFERIYELAREVCPAAFRASDANYVTRSADRAGLNSEETLLLFNYCLMYLRGRVDG